MDPPIICIGAINEGGVADPADEDGGSVLAELFDHPVALEPVSCADAYLDELMVTDGRLELPQQRFGYPGVADHDHRLQLVPEIPQELLL